MYSMEKEDLSKDTKVDEDSADTAAGKKLTREYIESADAKPTPPAGKEERKKSQLTITDEEKTVRTYKLEIEIAESLGSAGKKTDPAEVGPKPDSIKKGKKPIKSPKVAPCSDVDKVFGSLQMESPGLSSSDANIFFIRLPHSDTGDSVLVYNNDRYSPVRPPGIGELLPGQATTDNSKSDGRLDFRTSQSKTNCDDSVTFRYTGELDSGSFLRFTTDTAFSGEERVAKDGKILETHVKYNDPVDINFKSEKGEVVKIEKVTAVDAVRNKAGSYDVRVTSTKGVAAQFIVADNGIVVSAK